MTHNIERARSLTLASVSPSNKMAFPQKIPSGDIKNFNKFIDRARKENKINIQKSGCIEKNKNTKIQISEVQKKNVEKAKEISKLKPNIKENEKKEDGNGISAQLNELHTEKFIFSLESPPLQIIKNNSVAIKQSNEIFSTASLEAISLSADMLITPEIQLVEGQTTYDFQANITNLKTVKADVNINPNFISVNFLAQSSEQNKKLQKISAKVGEEIAQRTQKDVDIKVMGVSNRKK